MGLTHAHLNWNEIFIVKIFLWYKVVCACALYNKMCKYATLRTTEWKNIFTVMNVFLIFSHNMLGGFKCFYIYLQEHSIIGEHATALQIKIKPVAYILLNMQAAMTFVPHTRRNHQYMCVCTCACMCACICACPWRIMPKNWLLLTCFDYASKNCLMWSYYSSL